MKSAEEIVKGLECCTDRCHHADCPYGGPKGVVGCTGLLHEDALELIRLQEKQINRQSELITRAYPAPEPHDSVNHPEPHDPVNHPDHYTQGGIECKDAIKAAVTALGGYEGFLTGNAIKYLWRWKLKNGAEDLRKAVFWIQELIAETEEKA